MEPNAMLPKRQSSRKRVRRPSTPASEDNMNAGNVGAHFAASHKRRAVESSAIARQTPKRVPVRIEVSASPESSLPPVPTHDDIPPAHTCFVCRRRGGNYAFTCIFEADSTTCTRCAKEGHRCREATTQEKTALDARCPQCKSRGHARCHYPDGPAWQKGGQASCEVCIRRKKVCGVPVPRIETSVTQAFRQGTFARSQQQGQSLAPSNTATNSRSQRRSMRDATISSEQQKQSSTSFITAIRLKPQKKLRRSASTGADTTQTREKTNTTTTKQQPNVGSRHDDASRQLIMEAGEATLPSPPSTDSDMEGTVPAAAPSTSRVRRSTANYSTSYILKPWDDSDHDSVEEFSSYEEICDGDEGTISDETDEAAASSSEEGSSGQDHDEEDILSIEPEMIAKQKSKSAATSRSTRKGIDYSLPPMHDHETIFADLISRALELGLADALKSFDQPINVATMCSGTESPLFGLIASAQALKAKNQPSLQFRHLFSAEIEQFKQAFIERNFAPELLFRDIREFISEEARTATTAYGAVEAIPSGVHILVAGFSCKNLSRQNNHQKSLKENGESGETWMAVYEYSRRFRPSIVLLENVKSKASTWDDIVSQWSNIGYEAGWLYCDTKRYYYPQTRERMYMIAIERRNSDKKASQAVNDWKQTMRGLERPCSSPYEAFLAQFPRGSADYSALTSEWAWELCKLRYDHIRSELRLGIKRPCTKWSENGTKQPFDFADHDWFDSRSSREWEAIEVAYLRAAVVDGTDASYKEIIWDVSQNADRFHDNPGLVPCITPNGQVFSTNRQQPLSGMELLGLQGLPLDKLHLARESAAELQDMAGNAMSTTVIAASQLSAIICASQFFRSSSSARQKQTEELSPSSNKLVRLGKLTTIVPNVAEPHAVDMELLVQQAWLSSRLCSRECDERMCEAAVQACSACGHTICALHAGNPKHTYVHTLERKMRLESPNTFINEWRPKLPSRMSFKNFSGFSFSESFQAHLPRNRLTKAFGKRVDEADIESQQFYIGKFTRCAGFWLVSYISDQANLVLSIGNKLQWLLYVHCSPNEPSDSPLRKLLKDPIARGLVKESLLSAEWEIFIPSVRSIPLRIRGSSGTFKSFRNILGLLDFQTETIPARLHIYVDSNKPVDLPEEWDDFAGDYDYLPHCGTASASLYKRSSNEPLYFFLDPDPLSRGNDSFIFSYDCERLQSGEHRQTLAHLDPSWRPWNSADTNNKSIDAVSSGVWERAAVDTIILASEVLPMSAKVLKGVQSLNEVKNVCTTAISVLEADLPDLVPSDNLADYLWALDNVTSEPLFADWQSFGPVPEIDCACAPAYPRLLWNINKGGVATAYEDPKAAATRERAMKTRCPIFHVEPKVLNNVTRISFGVNVSSLTHRAVRNLIRTRQSTPTGPVNAAWRLLTNQRGAAPVRFPEFRLQSNAIDKPFSKQLMLAYELRGAQPRALEWMRAQERGTTFTLTEIEEAIHAKLGWRAEARAQANVLVRGGVLADRPSFGKTVITIALIQSEFEESREDKSIIAHNNSTFKQKLHLIDTAATLIVCPPHLVDQWQEEFEKFLGRNQYELYSIVSIKSFAELQDLEFEDMQNSRVIVVSWAVLADDQYIAHLAGFSAMPEPATASNVKGTPNYRAFDAWMTRVNQEIPAQLAKQQQLNSADFNASTDDLFYQRLNQPEFNMTLPLQVRHGSQYKPYSSEQTVKREELVNGIGKKGKPRRSSVPLLHLFRFNRIVVDEYHYLNVPQKDQKKAHGNLLSSVGIKAIAAHKRWILSGTPALGSFADVDNIASFLGIHLGKYTARANTGKRTQIEEMQSEAQTKVEKFLSHKETMSLQWHQARHERAQEFLDKFVRQNEPCLEHIRCMESLRVIELDVAHHAVYLELSQHLISQRMALKRMKNAEGTDRTSRLNASLNGSSTGEDALLKCALLYETYEGESGLKMLLQKRSQEYMETVSELTRLLRGFEGHRKSKFKGLQKGDKEEASIFQSYMYFRKDVCIDNWLGDDRATKKIRALLKHAEADPDRRGFIEGKNLDEKIKNAKKALSKIRTLANHLTFRIRSERFISNVQSLQQPLHKDRSIPRHCDSPDCQGRASISHLFLTSSCGHLSCDSCLAARNDTEACVVPSCNTTVQAMNLIKAIHLGSQHEPGSGKSFGRKLDAIATLIEELPDDEQGLVFAPDAKTIRVLKELCDHHAISYLTPSEKNPARAIQEFKSNSEVKVLILDLTSETAAGVNLYNANHIIFVAPVLVRSQYEYDAAMEQAIARSRRYGQEKQVHIYHFAALRTVDVDILEHRHKRKDGITDVTTPVVLPSTPLEKREPTKLIKNDQGTMALVPISWLADARAKQIMGVEENPESFTSLINFSETFENEV